MGRDEMDISENSVPDKPRPAVRRKTHRPILPEDIARTCRAIHRYLEIEASRADAAKRNVRLRMAIGLPPIPRRINRERRQ